MHRHLPQAHGQLVYFRVSSKRKLSQTNAKFRENFLSYFSRKEAKMMRNFVETNISNFSRNVRIFISQNRKKRNFAKTHFRIFSTNGMKKTYNFSRNNRIFIFISWFFFAKQINLTFSRNLWSRPMKKHDCCSPVLRSSYVF